MKNIGVIFYSKKNNIVYVADEVVRVLRKIREKELADKYYRRVLKTFKESQINIVCRKHNIDIKESDLGLKFEDITKTIFIKLGFNVDLAKKEGMNVVKSLLVAPDFRDDFVNDCDLEFEINLSLINAGSLVNILEGFRNSKHKLFPYQLLMKDVLIKEDRILKAINK